MRDTRFLFIEGIMGSGKTTTTTYLTEQLRRRSMPAQFLAEGPTLDEPVHPLRVATTLPHPNGVWLDVTAEEFRALSLRMWRDFTLRAERSPAVTICDGLLFHGNMTDLLLLDEEPETLHRYVADVLRTISGLRPVVIYLRQADVGAALGAIRNERGSAWEAYQVDWKLFSPYAIRRGLSGFAGLVALYETYRALCDSLFAELDVPKLALTRDGDWAGHYRDMLAFLELPAAAPPAPEAQ
jgi:hypothetical protein